VSSSATRGASASERKNGLPRGRLSGFAPLS
jgi:hypothetical protein